MGKSLEVLELLCIFAAKFSTECQFIQYTFFKYNAYEKNLTFCCYALHGSVWAS